MRINHTLNGLFVSLPCAVEETERIGSEGAFTPRFSPLTGEATRLNALSVAGGGGGRGRGEHYDDGMGVAKVGTFKVLFMRWQRSVNSSGQVRSVQGNEEMEGTREGARIVLPL